jgi:hypothetical protein
VLGTDGGDEGRLLVGHDVVAGTEAVEVRREVIAGVVRRGFLGVGLAELCEIEDLDAVVWGFL